MLESTPAVAASSMLGAQGNSWGLPLQPEGSRPTCHVWHAVANAFIEVKSTARQEFQGGGLGRVSDGGRTELKLGLILTGEDSPSIYPSS